MAKIDQDCPVIEDAALERPIVAKQIELSRGKVAIVDADDYRHTSEHKWSFTHYGYAVSWIGGRMVLMHRWLLGANDSQEVDHVNMDRLDNRRENIRVCTRSQNIANRNAPVNNTSGFKGVTWDKPHKMYRAQMAHVFLGLFADPAEAARAYDVAAKEHFGEFARLNSDGAVTTNNEP